MWALYPGQVHDGLGVYPEITEYKGELGPTWEASPCQGAMYTHIYTNREFGTIEQPTCMLS